MKMVEVFKTNVNDKGVAKKVIEMLYRKFPGCRINFDLDDRDRILRIEGDYLLAEMIKNIVNKSGILCEDLE